MGAQLSIFGGWDYGIGHSRGNRGGRIVRLV
jgi:hypothetical protein